MTAHRHWLLCFLSGILTLAATIVSAQTLGVRETLGRIDPRVMIELLETARAKPDAALTNIIPVEDNKFRYVFIWPADNMMMTHDRIGVSFAERFLQFAEKQRFLANGYCLTPENIGFVSTAYANQKINLAYRDIHVYREFGWREPCTGKFLTAAEVDEERRKAEQAAARLKALQLPVAPPVNPDGGLSPFFRGIQAPPE